MTPRPMNRSALAPQLGKYPHPKPLTYGTAGFRANADHLEEAIFRCGILAACRSHIHGGSAVGVMITASHNPAADNGLKIVEPDGSMFKAEWEPAATKFVNATDHPFEALDPLVDIDDVMRASNAVVVVGCDTRESSPKLAKLFISGVEIVGAKVINIDCVTTPQLHVAVCAYNKHDDVKVESYFTDIASAFKALVGKDGLNPTLAKNLVIDCANGVGAFSVSKIIDLLPGATIVNSPGEGPLNDQCGADYVQKKRIMPTVYAGESKGDFWASLDGDADRLVVFKPVEASNEIILADGDRFSALVTWFIVKHLKVAEVSDLSIAVAQTAYSNGAATKFFESLSSVEVVIAKTGVKHLERAVKPFDVGVYWEPNGHGTVLFSDKAIDALDKALSLLKGDESQTSRVQSLEALMAVTKVANQAVGDGVADLLLVLGILSFEKKSFDEWLELYEERCSCNMIVRVEDKEVIKTVDCDRQVEQPVALREAITDISNTKGCRAFVRPSGTEDVVRVYAEAPMGNEGKAKEMAEVICRAVFDHCGGAGERP